MSKQEYYKGFAKANVKALSYEEFISQHKHVKGIDLDDVYKVCGGTKKAAKKKPATKKKKSEDD
jgi:hypothetical protein